MAAGQAFLILLATLLAHLPVLRAGFVWDDDTFLTANDLIHAEDGLWRFWFSTAAPDYFPLTSSLLWLEWRLFGPEPAGYHLVNLALHGLNALLLWRVLRAMALPGAWLAALIFAVHPVNVETVAWITQLKNLLPMTCFLAALLAWLSFEGNGRPRAYLAALLFFLAGLLAKTSIVMLPVVLLGWVWWQRGGVRRADWLRLAPFFALSVALGLVTVWFQAERAIGTEVVRSDGLLDRLVTAGAAVWFYLGKALWPVDLSFVYSRWSPDAASAGAWLPLAGLVLSFLVLLRFRSRAWALAVLATLAYFIVMLLPVLGFLDIYFMRYSLVSDHWQYFALIGPVALGSAWFAQRWRQAPRPAVLACFALVVVCALGTLSFQRAQVFHDAETLWTDTLRKNAGCWLAHNELGLQRQRAGELEGAMLHYESALRLQPDFPEARNNLGLALMAAGRTEEALWHYGEAIRLQPHSTKSLINRGNALQRLGRHRDSLQDFYEVLRLEPARAEIHNNVGVLLCAVGQPWQAVPHFEQALRLAPDHAKAGSNLQRVLQELGAKNSSPPR
ncbi:MAG: tetratricopeptide repeat protein [Planctomycetota bacterium]